MKYTVEKASDESVRIEIDSMSSVAEMNSLVLLILNLLKEGKRVIVEG